MKSYIPVRIKLRAVILSTLALLIVPDLSIAQHQGKTLLAIFAHPDDEMTIAPILVKYGNEGAKVHLVICTDGRYGTNDFSGLEAGEGLVAIRQEELRCSASKLGVELTHLDYHDQLKASGGYDGHVPHVQALIKEVYELVERIQPDVIITFGPDGASNHMDHRLVGATVTQVYTSKVWDKPSTLYYYGRPSESIEDPESKILRGQNMKYLTTRILYTEKELDAVAAAAACHKSQISPDRIKNVKERYRKDMTVYLRKFEAPAEQKTSVF
ncbi:MAG: PIG-L deacetylase family protein [Aurantibacter sp.]